MSDPVAAQIAALQHIVRIQDELIRSEEKSEIAKMWRNEAYKANVHKRIMEDETVKMGRDLVGQLSHQRNHIGSVIGREFGKRIHLFEEGVSKSLHVLEKKIQRMEIEVSRLREVSRSQRSQMKDVEELRSGNKRLQDENDALRRELERTKDGLESSDRERARLLRELIERGSGKVRYPNCDVPSEKRKNSVHDVLREIKELELEAKQLLIKE